MQALASTGCATQFVQDMTWTSMCRRVFITQDGQLGLGPRTVADGDVVAVLPGSSIPLFFGRRRHGPRLSMSLLGQRCCMASWITKSQKRRMGRL